MTARQRKGRRLAIVRAEKGPAFIKAKGEPIVDDALRSARAAGRPVKPGMCECRSGLKAGACTHEMGRVHPSLFPCADRHTHDRGGMSNHDGLRRWAAGWQQTPCPVCRRLCVWVKPGPDGNQAIAAFRAARVEAGDSEAIATCDRALVHDEEDALITLSILMDPGEVDECPIR